MRWRHGISLAIGLACGLLFAQLIRKPGNPKGVEPESSLRRMPLSHHSSLQAENANGSEQSDAIVVPPQVVSEELLNEYLEEHEYSRSAMIAAALLSRDIAHLVAAAERFPDDPHIQALVLGDTRFPGDKTEWFKRFKQSQPDNLLASMLLGSHLLKSGDIEAGLAELRTGCGQSNYRDFTAESSLAIEAALIDLGRSRYDAKLKASGVSSIGLINQLQHGNVELRKLVDREENPERRIELLEIGAAVGNQLSQGRANSSATNRLIGLSIERGYLKSLPPDHRSETFSQTPAELLGEISAERSRLSEEIDFAVEHHEKLDETQMMHYIDRVRALGESQANAWMRDALDLE